MKDKLIDMYLKNKLVKEEKESFFKLIKNDEDFKLSVIARALLLRSLRNVGRRRDEAVISSIDSFSWETYYRYYGKLSINAIYLSA